MSRLDKVLKAVVKGQITGDTSPMDYSYVENGMERAAKKYEDGLFILGGEYRMKTLIPFCDKHKVEFSSGMGGFTLGNEEYSIYSHDDFDITMPDNIDSDEEGDMWYDSIREKISSEEFSNIIKTLSAGELMSSHAFATYIDNYKPDKF